MFAQKCKKEEAPAFPLTWSETISKEGIYDVEGYDDYRLVVLAPTRGRFGPLCVFAYDKSDGETWSPIQAQWEGDHFKLTDKKLCLEIE